MKGFLVVFGLGAGVLFTLVMFCAGMQAAFGENAVPAMFGLIGIGICSTILGFVIASIFEDTKWMKKLKRWSES